MKKVWWLGGIVFALTIAWSVLTPGRVLADVITDDNVCQQVYGGGVVCPAVAPLPEHIPLETGFADEHPVIFASVLLAAAGVLIFISRKLALRPSEIID